MVARVSERDLATLEIILDRALYRCRGPDAGEWRVVVRTVLASVAAMRDYQHDEATSHRLDRLEAKARQHG